MSGGNLAGLLDGPAQWSADRPAILVGDRPVRTWSELAEAVARRGASLRDRFGVLPGDAVAIFAANCASYLEVLFSVWHAGAVAVPISNRLHPREAAALVESSRAKVCFADVDLGGPVVDISSPVDSDPIARVPRRLDDDAWIFFTSGTTGRAKGARLTHGNLFAMAVAYYADAAEVGPSDSIIHVASLSHASGLMSLPFIGRGAAQVLPESGKFDVAELFELVAAGERSTFFVPPTLLRRICDSPVSGDGIGTVMVGAAPVLPSDLKRGHALLGPVLWNGYGQGESPCTITAHGKAAIAAAVEANDEERLASVGVARLATRVRVVGPDDEPLPPGEVGEVVVDGPTVMAGYLDMPEASAETLRGGWLHTGDLGRFDETGHLTLVDRAKDVVISGGYNVYPREVEDVLLTDPAVADVAVLGVPDEEWGERVIAYVVAPNGVDEGALDQLCLDTIARHKRPKEYVVIDELPRNAAGKVLKRSLRELYLEQVPDAAR
jgi:long-chain acyl-CoA synthetase